MADSADSLGPALSHRMETVFTNRLDPTSLASARTTSRHPSNPLSSFPLDHPMHSPSQAALSKTRIIQRSASGKRLPLLELFDAGSRPRRFPGASCRESRDSDSVHDHKAGVEGGSGGRSSFKHWSEVPSSSSGQLRHVIFEIEERSSDSSTPRRMRCMYDEC